MIGYNVSLFVFLLLISFLNFGFLMNIKETNLQLAFLAYPSALNKILNWMIVMNIVIIESYL